MNQSNTLTYLKTSKQHKLALLSTSLSIAKMYALKIAGNRRECRDHLVMPCTKKYLVNQATELRIDNCKICDKFENDIKGASTDKDRKIRVEAKERYFELAEKTYNQNKGL